MIIEVSIVPLMSIASGNLRMLFLKKAGEFFSLTIMSAAIRMHVNPTINARMLSKSASSLFSATLNMSTFVARGLIIVPASSAFIEENS